MSDPQQNRITTRKKFFAVKKPCGVLFITPHGFVFLTVRRRVWGINQAEIRHIPVNVVAAGHMFLREHIVMTLLGIRQRHDS